MFFTDSDGLNILWNLHQQKYRIQEENYRNVVPDRTKDRKISFLNFQWLLNTTKQLINVKSEKLVERNRHNISSFWSGQTDGKKL